MPFDNPYPSMFAETLSELDQFKWSKAERSDDPNHAMNQINFEDMLTKWKYTYITS